MTAAQKPSQRPALTETLRPLMVSNLSRYFSDFDFRFSPCFLYRLVRLVGSCHEMTNHFLKVAPLCWAVLHSPPSSSVMPMPDFYGPNLKVERAKHHIDQLEIIFDTHISRNIERLRPKKNSRGLNRARDASLATFPKHTPTVLGDAIHNLRAALDHAYCIMVEANANQVSDWTHFRKSRKSLEDLINGHKNSRLTPSDTVIGAIIDKIQPYENGKLGLYGLHLLDITDKHGCGANVLRSSQAGAGKLRWITQREPHSKSWEPCCPWRPVYRV